MRRVAYRTLVLGGLTHLSGYMGRFLHSLHYARRVYSFRQTHWHKYRTKVLDEEFS
nr:MAG TPA: hypothetical protein [Caudoviricetes sp.]